MNRAIISQRITSILAEIERLNNALYAMNTTDIQRYPDNYEVLSTDAALRAERITCRLRHLIYATRRAICGNPSNFSDGGSRLLQRCVCHS